MFLLGLIFLVLVLVAFPFSLLVYSNAPTLLLLGTPCFQPVTLFGVSLFAAGIRLVLMALFLLKDPFSFPTERLHVDSVLATIDRTMFTLLRAQFRSSDDDNIDSQMEPSPNGIFPESFWNEELEERGSTLSGISM